MLGEIGVLEDHGLLEGEFRSGTLGLRSFKHRVGNRDVGVGEPDGVEVNSFLLVLASRFCAGDEVNEVGVDVGVGDFSQGNVKVPNEVVK